MLEVFGFAIHAEFAVVVGEEVRLRAKVEFGEDATHPTDVLPHHVFAADLERLWEMVQLLILGCLFKVFGFGLASPLHVPFGAVWAHNTETSILQSIDYGVVDVSCLRNLETEHHVVLLEVLLASYLNFLERSKQRLRRPI